MREKSNNKNRFRKLLNTDSNLVMILAGVVGCIIIICLFFFEEFYCGTAIDPKHYAVKKDFLNLHPAYLTWATIMVLQGALWGILIFPATNIILRLKQELGTHFHFRKTFFILVFSQAILIILCFYTVMNYLHYPGSSYHFHLFKIHSFTVMAMLTGIYFLSGINMVGKKCLFQISQNDFDIMDYRRLRGYQDILLNFAGLILSLGVITSILFNKATQSENTGSNAFPAEFVISFGLFNTLPILIFYLPNYFIMLDYGKRIIENKFPLEKASKEIIQSDLENQSALSKNLKLDLTFTDSIKKTLIVLSPLLSSFLPKLFNLFEK